MDSFLRCLWSFALSAHMVTAASQGFNVEVASELHDFLFGPSAQMGWLGGDHVSSFRLNGDRHIWTFANIFTNLTGKSAKPEGDEIAQCNYFPSRNCAMPTNGFATWSGSASSPASGPLLFHTRIDERSGRPTSMLWPPGWGSSGRTPKVPSCESCSLWAPPTALHRSPEECGGASGGGRVEMDKGGCCSQPPGSCPGYCCRDELYFGAMVGVASPGGDRVFLLAQMGKASELMPRGGETFGTHGVSISNAGVAASPEEWTYASGRMPGTHVWPWSDWNESKQFFSAISSAHSSTQPDLVYILGFAGPFRVLARALLPDLLDFRWHQMEFWAEGQTWQRHEHSAIPALAPLWKYDSSETSLHFDERIKKWLVPEVRSEDKVIVFRLAPGITGPWERLVVGPVPLDALQSDLAHWDVGAVKSHPELASAGCLWVLSMVFRWRSPATPPPLPGLHRFPRLLCVRGDLSLAPPPSAPLPGAAGAAACSPALLRITASSMACGMGSGCHSCGSRAEYLVDTQGSMLEAAYRIIAAQFPEDCGVFKHCTGEEIQAAALEAWALGPGRPAAAPAAPGAGAGWLAAPALAACLALAGLAAGRRRRARRGLLEAGSDAEYPDDDSRGGVE